MIVIRYTIILVTLIGSWSLQGQTSKVKEGDKKFEDLAYIDALQIYEDVARKGYGNEDLYRRLGDGHYFNANYIEAARWYNKLFLLNSIQPSIYNFRYGQSLKTTGSYKNADVILRPYYNAQGIDYTSTEQYLKLIAKRPDRFILSTVAFNSTMSDYPAFLKGDDLYVVSSRSGNKETPWNGEPTSDIFTFNKGSLNPLEGDINTIYNEGSIVITQDGKTMFFTRNNYNGGKVRKDLNKVIRLKLYRAKNVGGKWGNIEELPFNSDEYSVGHPALNNDESKLYFASDMPGNGNIGGTDIFGVELNEDGSYGTIFNMPSFNTIGNELFPFVASDGTFYFSSNGQIVNLGGLDVYMSKANENGVYNKVYNVGKPINSTVDDLAFVINGDNKTGFFASNRNIGQSDDIYKLMANDNFQEPCLITIHGMVKDKNTGEPLPNSVVTLLDENNNIIDRQISNEGSLYSFSEMNCNDVQFIRAEKNGYQTNEAMYSEQNSNNFYNILLDNRTIELREGADLGLIIKPIYFNYDRFNIHESAAVELQKIIAIMQQNLAIKIDVRSHTDSRDTASYNLSLSNKRVVATINYIVKNGGIDRSRLSGRGYGESQLINGCVDTIPCSEYEHQQNRRSEFIIVK